MKELRKERGGEEGKKTEKKKKEGRKEMGTKKLNYKFEPVRKKINNYQKKSVICILLIFKSKR